MTVIGRRQFLAAAGMLGIVAAAGVGAVAAVATPRSRSRPVAVAPPSNPVLASTQLAAALDRERALIAGIDAALAAGAELHQALPNIRADHASHADAISAAIAATGATVPSPTPSAPSSATATSPTASATATATADSVEALRAAESAAQQAGAMASAQLAGRDAVLLASVSACEAGHVELLT